MRILLAGGNALFASGLRHLLEAGGHTVVATASDGLEAVVKAGVMRPDVILMELHMSGSCALEPIRRIKAELPAVRIVVIIVHEGDVRPCEPIRSLVSDYLPMSEAGTRLLDILPRSASPAGSSPPQ